MPILEGELERVVIDLRKEEQEKVVEAKTEDVVVLPDSDKYTLSSVIVKGVTAGIDENIKPENIRLGASILGVAGNVAPDKPDQEKTIYPSEQEQVVIADTGYELAKVVAKAVETESFLVEPSRDVQTITAGDGKYIKEVEVGAIPSDYVQVGGSIDITENGTYDVTSFVTAKVNIGGVGEKTLYLPNAFSTVGQVYSFAVSENIILLSGDVSGIGVWEYDLRTNACVQLWKSLLNYQYFQMVGTDCLIGGSSTYLLLYDGTQRTIKSLYGGYDWRYFFIYGDKVIVSSSQSSNGLLVYNGNTKTAERVISSFGGILTISQLQDRLIIGSTGGYGVWVYDLTLNTATQVLTANNSGYVKHFLTNQLCFISHNSSTAYAGIWVYNYTTNSATKLYTAGVQWQYGFALDNGDCILSANGNYGIVLYSASENTITQIYSGGGYWSAYCDVGEDLLIGGVNGSNSKGLLNYNKQTKAVSILFSNNSAYNTFYKLDDVVLIGCYSGSGDMGMIVYDRATKTATLGAYYGVQFIYSLELPEVMLFGSNNSSYYGFLEYDKQNRTFRKPMAYGSLYNQFIVSGDKIEVSSSSARGYKFTYDPTTREVLNLRISLEV